MATLKELRQGDKRWIGTCYKGNTLTTKEKCDASDVKDYNPDDYVSLTVPGQSKSISELMERYEKGRPTPNEL